MPTSENFTAWWALLSRRYNSRLASACRPVETESGPPSVNAALRAEPNGVNVVLRAPSQP